MEMSEENARVYDPETGKVTAIPIRELSDAMIAIRLEGVEGVVYVDQSLVQIEKGPLRHETLSRGLVERIESLAEVFAEVLPGTPEDWIDDFRRDEHPDSELAVWERIAERFLHSVDPADSLERKQDVLKVLLSCANNSPQVTALTAECQSLTRDEVHTICEEWIAAD
jgi:hypothetical protein